MATTPDPFYEDAPQLWDTCYLLDKDGRTWTLPGVATVTGEAEYGLDVRLAPLQSGAYYIWKGTPPINLQIALTFWSAEQWEYWHRVYDLIRPPAKRQLVPTTFGIVHPVATNLGVQDVIVTKITAPTVPPQGLVNVAIKTIQYMKPVPIKSPVIRPPTISRELFNPLNGSPQSPPTGLPSASPPPAPKR